MTSLKALETSLQWQKIVLETSRKPDQKKRVQAAIVRLQSQIDNLKGVQS